jgi:hypothetical protein
MSDGFHVHAFTPVKLLKPDERLEVGQMTSQHHHPKLDANDRPILERLRLHRALLIVAVVGLLAFVGIVVGVAVASRKYSPSPPRTYGAITNVALRQMGPGAVVPPLTRSFEFVDVPGAGLTLTIPRREQALILVRFTGDSYCYFSSTQTFKRLCDVQVLIDGQPISGEAFDMASPYEDGYESHALDRWAGPYRAGPHTVSMQFRVEDSGQNTVFTLGYWTLVAEAVKVPKL